MLNEPHYPSKWTVAAVFFVILLLMTGVFAWAFYFNLGTFVFRSDEIFSVFINDKTHICDEGVCEVTLPPGVYQATASREGYYDEVLTVRIERLQTLEESLAFELVPFLNASRTVEVPAEPTLPFEFRIGTEESALIDSVSRTEITRFESLVDPVLRVADEFALVIDTGRLFFVNLVTGRKERRFDESVQVQDGLLSDNGERSILFVQSQGLDQLWMYDHTDDQLSPLTWTAEPQFLQWEPDSSQVIYVLSDQLQESQSPSLFADLLQVSELTSQGLALFQVDFSSSQVRQLQAFESGEQPQALLRRGERFFIEFQNGEFEELVIR